MSTTVEEADGQPSLMREGLAGYRIAAGSYGALNPQKRDYFFLDDVGHWNRYDTHGRTLYIAQERKGAFTECLYSYRLGLESRSAIQFIAERFGLGFEAARDLHAEEMSYLGHEEPGMMPASWRDGRRLYRIESTNELTWLDLNTSHSLDYIEQAMGPEIHKTCGLMDLDLSQLLGSNRLLTTLVAGRLRDLQLVDGGFADGIRFISKHGAGVCCAFWMRRTDDDLDNELLTSGTGVSITADDPDLFDVSRRFGIKFG